jgi:uncharacterized protein YukE
VNAFPDTAQLRTQAHRIDAEASDLTSRCTALRSAAQQTRWVSLAASRYQAQIAVICSDLDAVVGALHHAAAVLRAHADSVDHIVHVMLAAEQAALQAAQDVAATGLKYATAPVHALAGLL